MELKNTVNGRIMFMGTPDIAAGVLTRLIDSGADVVCAVTGEDKPRGRGNVMTPTPVKRVALSAGIPVLTPKTLRDGAFRDSLDAYRPELIVVVAYGKLLPDYVLDYPSSGCVNVHVSLLPKYRGAAPMQRAIMDGERETGVTLMYMDHGLDTGDIIAQTRFPIGDRDDFEAIHDRSMTCGAELLIRLLPDILSGTAPRVKQPDTGATYAKKIEKCDTHLDFRKSARQIDFIIRGLCPIPYAVTELRGRLIKICTATPTEGHGEPGEVIAVDGKGDGSFTVACGEGALRVTSVIPEGKGRMPAGDLVRGRKIDKGDKLTCFSEA